MGRRLLVRRNVVLAIAAGVLALAPAAPARAAEEPPTMAFVGDSIGHRAEAEIRTEVTQTRRITQFFAADAATIGPSRHQVGRAVIGPDAPDILVVELGHGDANLLHRAGRLTREIRAFLDATAPHVDCVRWLDVKPRDSLWPNINANGRLVNRLLRQIAGEYPNVEVVHYSTWAAHAAPGHWHADQLHLSGSGRRELGRIVRQAADGCDPGLTSGPFWDVRDDFSAARAISWLAAEGITTGFANGSYRALIGSRHLPMTRGELMTMLWRLVGSPSGADPAPWTDIPPAMAPAAAWVADLGLIAGHTASTFRPSSDLSRGQFVRALWRLAGRPMVAGEPPPDVPSPLARAVVWGLAEGVVRIFADGSFRASLPVDRGLVANALAPEGERGPLAQPSPAGSYPSPPVTPLAVHGDPWLAGPG